MRRPIIAVFLGFASGIVLEYYISGSVWIIFLCSIGVGILFASLYKKNQLAQFDLKQDGVLMSGAWNYFFPLSLFIAFLLLGAFSAALTENKDRPLDGSIGDKTAIVGEVISLQKKDENYYQMLLRCDYIQKNKEKEQIFIKDSSKVLVKLSGELIASEKTLVGYTVRIQGTVEQPTGKRNPATFDYRLYLKTRGIYHILSGKTGSLAVMDKPVNLTANGISLLKIEFTERLMSKVDQDTLGILIGMLFGDKTLMDEDVYESFQKNGIAHILSVSGIHVGIVYICIGKLFRNKRRVGVHLIIFIFLLFYAALAEFSPSVVRAVTMIFVHIISKITFRRYDLTCATASCAFGMLIVNPYYLFNIGFQLSYLAVFILAVALPWAGRRIALLSESPCPKVFILLLRYIAPLFVIQAGMAVYTAYCFNYFSLGALILNIPIIFIAGFIIPVGIFLLIMSFFMGGLTGSNGIVNLIYEILDFAFSFASFLAKIMVSAMDYANQLFYKPGISFFAVVSPKTWVLILFYLLFFFLLSESFRVLYQRNEKQKILIIFLGIFILSTGFPKIFTEDLSGANLVFADVSQGDCLHIRTPLGKNILIDGGGNLNYNVGKKVLLPYLLKNGVKEVDLAIATHLHSDHYLGICQLAQEMKIRKLGLYEVNKLKSEKITQETGISEGNMIYLKKDQIIPIEKDISIQILYPFGKSDEEYERALKMEEDENENSLILKVNFQDISVLMTGDLGFDGEDKLVDLYKEGQMKADILKVGHHGSKYSTSKEFLTAVSPKIAVIQVGKNNFGHPNPGVIEKFNDSGIIVYRNDKQGGILLTKKKTFFEKFMGKEGKWHIKTMIKENMPLKK